MVTTKKMEQWEIMTCQVNLIHTYLYNLGNTCLSFSGLHESWESVPKQPAGIQRNDMTRGSLKRVNIGSIVYRL